MSVYTAPTAAYKQQSILTATPGQLVVMLYDGCLRFLQQGALAMRDENLAEAGTRLSRAEAIIDELLSTLDMEQGGQIASRLQGIYVFCIRHLMEARLERDAGKIEKVGELLSELRDSWVHVAAPPDPMDPWTALLARATADRQLAAEGRWEELAESTAEHVRAAAALGPAPLGAKLVLEALAVVQSELTATLARARAEVAREIAALPNARGAVAGYAAAQAAPTRQRWVDDAA